MNLIFANLKKLKNGEFDFFYKLQKAQKILIQFFATFKKLEKNEFNFLKA